MASEDLANQRMTTGHLKRFDMQSQLLLRKSGLMTINLPKNINNFNRDSHKGWIVLETRLGHNLFEMLRHVEA